MAGATDLVILAFMAAGGYLLYKECFAEGKDCFGGTTEPDPNTDCVADPTAAGCEADTGNSGNGNGNSGGSQCGDLCKSKDCSGYKKKCTTGCVHCCGSGKNSPKCGSGGSSGGSSGGGINCNDGHNCGERCAKGWCTSYRGCNCKLAGGCAKCGQGGSGGSTNCPDLCRRKECSSYISKCGKSGCSQCSCSSLCSSGQCSVWKAKCGGSCSHCTTDKGCSSPSNCPTCSSGKSRSCKNGVCGCQSTSSGSSCVVTKCPSCGALPKYRVCQNNKCGCAKLGAYTQTFYTSGSYASTYASRFRREVVPKSRPPRMLSATAPRITWAS